MLLMLQARLTYELAMANRDAASVDDGRDYDDRMSDDSSGTPSPQRPALLCTVKHAFEMPTHVLLPETCSVLVCCPELLERPP